MISIIIPVYNTEKYVKECIYSVLEQTYEDIEVLLIDDGSTDLSPQICREFAEKDSRIQVYSIEHSGVSAARNTALDMAQGEFVLFLDSDDMIAPGMLEQMHEQMHVQKTDMSFCRYLQSDNVNQLNSNGNKGWVFCDNAKLIELFSERIDIKVSMHGIGGKLIRREKIGNLRFAVDLAFTEDTLFLYQLIQTGISACYTLETMYYYREREGSSCSLKFTLKGLTDTFSVMKKIGQEERKYGRIENSYFWEMKCLETLKFALDHLPENEWVKIKNKVKEEKAYPRFFLNWIKIRISVFLGCCSYPLYRKIRKIYRQLMPWKRKNERDY